jgi:hypothetical protein
MDFGEDDDAPFRKEDDPFRPKAEPAGVAKAPDGPRMTPSSPPPASRESSAEPPPAAPTLEASPEVQPPPPDTDDPEPPLEDLLGHPVAPSNNGPKEPKPPFRRPAPVKTERIERTPPHDLDAEVSVLGAVLLDNAVLEEVAALVGEADFYRESHRRIFAAMLSLAADGPIDAVLLREELRKRGDLEAVGGPEAIVNLLERVPSAANAIEYAGIVRKTSQRRTLIAEGDRLARIGFEGEVDPVAALLEFSERAKVAAEGGDVEAVEFVGGGDLVDEKIERPAPVICGPEKDGPPLLSMGQIILIAGPPKVGKSVLATDLLGCLAQKGSDWLGLKTGGPFRILVFSAEGGLVMIQDRLQHQAGVLGREVLNRIRIPRKMPSIRLPEGRSVLQLRRLIEGEEVQGVLLDPLFRMHRVDENSNREMGEVMAALEELRTSTGVFISLVHHTARAMTENVKGKPSRRSRGASVVEADADAIATLDSPDEEIAGAAAFLFWEVRWCAAPPNAILFRDQFFHHHVGPLGKKVSKRASAKLTFDVVRDAFGESEKMTLHQLAGALKRDPKTLADDLTKVGLSLVVEVEDGALWYRLAKGSGGGAHQKKMFPGDTGTD